MDRVNSPSGPPGPDSHARGGSRRGPVIFALVSTALATALLGGWGVRIVLDRRASERDREAVGRARELLQRGFPQRAIRAVERVSPEGAFAAEALTVRGLGWVALGRVEEAARALERSLELDPRQPMAAKVLAAICFSRSEVDRGMALLGAAARLDPEDFRPWYAMGTIHERTGKPDRAAPCFRRALELKPDDFDSLVGLIRSELRLGRPEQAEPLLGRALAARPDDPEALALAARLERDLGRPDEALRRVDRCLAIDPDHGEALLTRARLLLESGRPEPALEDAERAVASAPNDPAALNLLATIESRLGLAERAEATRARREAVAARLERMHALTEQIAARPDDPEPRWRLGQEAAEAGERTLAEQSFRAALAIDPGCRPARIGLERLGVGPAPTGTTIRFP